MTVNWIREDEGLHRAKCLLRTGEAVHLLVESLGAHGWVRWSPSVRQFGGWVKLGLGLCQAASLSVSLPLAPYASSGVRPARAEWGRTTL